MEGVVARLELSVVAAGVTLTAGLYSGLDQPQLSWAGAAGGQPAGLGLLDPPELEQHEYVVQVGRHEEAAPPSCPEHALAVRDVQAPALLRPDPAGRRENLGRF